MKFLRQNLSLLIMCGTYSLPLCIAGCFVSVNKAIFADGLMFPSPMWLVLFWLSLGGIAGYIVLLFVAYRLAQPNRIRQFTLPLLAAGLVTIFALAMLEIGLRIASTPHPFGRELGSRVFKPYEWDTVKEYNQTLYEKSQKPDSYYVGHSKFGWTVGPSRTSEDMLYSSSAEGLRSRVVGEALLPVAGKVRIALFGDSFMFSEEVSYEDSLASRMEDALGAKYQILNFGVPGYGIDQAYLRFTEEVDLWAPKIAILGFIADDLNRAVDVYTFLKPSWGIPFSKPRFLANEQGLQLLNVPTIAPDKMFGLEAISDLPHLSLEINYFDFDWQHKLLHNSFLIRVLATFLPKYPPENNATNPVAVSDLGARLAKQFVEDARLRGIEPILVYLPSRSDFRENSTAVALKEATISKALTYGLQVVDMTGCLTESIDPERLFVEGGFHYAGDGNQVFASCLISLLPTLEATTGL